MKARDPIRRLRALTLWRPWPWTFQCGADPKRLENREWPLYPWMVGELVALHSGGTWDHGNMPLIQRLAPDLPPDPAAHPSGMIFAVVRFGTPFTDPPTASRWFMGPGVGARSLKPIWGWPVTEYIALPEPVTCTGHQKLWMPSPEIAARVLAQIATP